MLLGSSACPQRTCASWRAWRKSTHSQPGEHCYNKLLPDGWVVTVFGKHTEGNSFSKGIWRTWSCFIIFKTIWSLQTIEPGYKVCELWDYFYYDLWGKLLQENNKSLCLKELQRHLLSFSLNRLRLKQKRFLFIVTRSHVKNCKILLICILLHYHTYFEFILVLQK